MADTDGRVAVDSAGQFERHSACFLLWGDLPMRSRPSLWSGSVFVERIPALRELEVQSGCMDNLPLLEREGIPPDDCRGDLVQDTSNVGHPAAMPIDILGGYAQLGFGIVPEFAHDIRRCNNHSAGAAGRLVESDVTLVCDGCSYSIIVEGHEGDGPAKAIGSKELA